MEIGIWAEKVTENPSNLVGFFSNHHPESYFLRLNCLWIAYDFTASIAQVF